MKKITLVFFVLLLSLTQYSCKKTVPAVSKTEIMMDTFVTITIYGSVDGGGALLEEAFRLVKSYELMFSKTIPDSDVNKINSSYPEAVEVSSETVWLIKLAMDYNGLSGGLFDVTIGGAAELWKFDGTQNEPPEEDLLSEALKGVGAENILVEGNTVRLLNPATRIDLGGIAKGYIADRAAEFLLQKGVPGAVIDLGGDVKAVGRKDGKGFRVGIINPLGEGFTGIIAVEGKSVVTSGSYERFFDFEGTAYHHIIDPFTGYPRATDILSATIITDECADGDALATIAFMLGKEKALELIESIPGAEGIFVGVDGGIIYSSGVGNVIPFETE